MQYLILGWVLHEEKKCFKTKFGAQLKIRLQMTDELEILH